jgi:predicted transcriptional regulator
MTKLLELAFEEAKQLPPEDQDELARTIMEIVHGGEEGVYVLSEEEEAAIEVGLAEADRGEFASEEEIEAIFAKYRA